MNYFTISPMVRELVIHQEQQLAQQPDYTFMVIMEEEMPRIYVADEEDFLITVVPTPDVDDIANKSSCDYYILPEITGDHLSGNEAFYTSQNGSGTSYIEGGYYLVINYFIYL